MSASWQQRRSELTYASFEGVFLSIPPPLALPIPFMTAYILSPSATARSRRLMTSAAAPSPGRVPSAFLSKGRILFFSDRGLTWCARIILRISPLKSTAPTRNASASFCCNALAAISRALRPAASSQDTVKLGPPKRNSRATRLATMLPKAPNVRVAVSGWLQASFSDSNHLCFSPSVGFHPSFCHADSPSPNSGVRFEKRHEPTCAQSAFRCKDIAAPEQ